MFKNIYHFIICKKESSLYYLIFAVGCSKIRFINTFSLFYAFWISIYLDL